MYLVYTSSNNQSENTTWFILPKCANIPYQLAQMSKIKETELFRLYENDRCFPSVERAIAISRIVGVPVEKIWTGPVILKRAERKKPQKAKRGVLQRLFSSPK